MPWKYRTIGACSTCPVPFDTKAMALPIVCLWCCTGKKNVVPLAFLTVLTIVRLLSPNSPPRALRQEKRPRGGRDTVTRDRRGVPSPVVACSRFSRRRPRPARSLVEPAAADFALDVAARYSDVLEHMIVEALEMSALRSPLQPLRHEYDEAPDRPSGEAVYVDRRSPALEKKSRLPKQE